jgi:glutamate N-acetyltransferase/amino-acid N-acetyltransferase
VLTRLQDGTVTSPAGFTAGAFAAGVKYQGRLDLGIVASDRPGRMAGVFTRNAVKSAPVLVCQRRIPRGGGQAVIVNSGCANACTGPRGLHDAEQMARLAASHLGIQPDDVFVAGTGVIGTFLPLDRIAAGVSRLSLDRQGGHDFARAIMTTDTRAKELAVSVTSAAGAYHIGAAAKGSGMIHPDMGTMLCFITTDANVDGRFLQEALALAADTTFNMVSVDGDTSPSDTVLLLANGNARTSLIGPDNGAEFEQALLEVCTYLATSIAADGEGATKLLEVSVNGAVDDHDARRAARCVAGSSLVKTAIHGADPNWGRVVCAVGRSGAAMDPDRVSLSLNDVPVMSAGMPVPFSEDALRLSLQSDHVRITIDLHLGPASATAWGCDLSHEYVTINASYTT